MFCKCRCGSLLNLVTIRHVFVCYVRAVLRKIRTPNKSFSNRPTADRRFQQIRRTVPRRRRVLGSEESDLYLKHLGLISYRQRKREKNTKLLLLADTFPGGVAVSSDRVCAGGHAERGGAFVNDVCVDTRVRRYRCRDGETQNRRQQKKKSHFSGQSGRIRICLVSYFRC